VPASGGAPQPLTDSKAPHSHRWPQALPGGKGVLFMATAGGPLGSLQVLTRGGGEPRTLVENALYGRYLATGLCFISSEARCL